MYDPGQVATVAATPASGYSFVNWTEGSTVVSTRFTYTFTLTTSRALVANFRQTPACLFHEDFDDVTGWTRKGLWYIRDVGQTECFRCLAVTGKYAYYARSGACDYSTGKRTSGYLTSPLIGISGLTRLELRFDFFRHVEAYARAARDRTYVQISLGGGTWRTVWTRDSRSSSPECGSASVVFDTRGARTLRVRFVFDSANGLNNVFPGWAVDNVCVRPATPDERPTVFPVEEFDSGDGAEVEGTGIFVSNRPNPVRDVHTTTFSVRGAQVELVIVEVYDLGGKLVWKGEAAGAELVWHTEDLTGFPLASGVYLCTVKVRVLGEWIALGPEKLVILR